MAETTTRQFDEAAISSEQFEMVKPVTPNPDLYPARNEKGELEYNLVHYLGISPSADDRVTHPSAIKVDGKMYCYKNIRGEWIPELRWKARKTDEQEKLDMYFRVEQNLESTTSQVAGVLARGEDVIDLMHHFRPQARGRSAFSTIVTAHAKPEDVYGRACNPEEMTTGDGPQGHTRVSVLNVLNDKNWNHEVTLQPLVPGTREKDLNFSIRPEEINRKPLTFEGIATDNQTIGFYDPAQEKWTVQTVPFGKLDIHPYDARNHYTNGFFTGILAQEIDGETYIFRLDEHMKRAARDAKKTQIPDVTEDMLYEMTRAQLTADRRWIPNAHDNVDDPVNGEKGTGNRYYYRMFGVPTHEGPRIAAPKDSANFMMGAIGTVVGPYKGDDMLNIVLRGDRPVAGMFMETKHNGNYTGPMADLLPYMATGYHEGLFTQPDGFTREGRHILEGSGCNYIVRIGNSILMPPRNVLPGITARSVIELAKSYGYDIEEGRSVEVSCLMNADEILATGTAMSVRGVGKIDVDTGEKNQDGKPIMKTIFGGQGETKMGALAQRVSDDLKLIMRREHSNPKFNDWMQKIS